MVEVKNVKKQLGSFVLEDISFSLPKGYIMGLIGANGAGKTTLLHLLLGLYAPDEGSVKIDGMEAYDEEVRVRGEIGYVLNEELFCGGMTLLQNGDLYGKYYESYDRELLKAYCGRFGLLVNKPLKKYSKGEKLKFQFAFALAHKPKLLLLDEPMASFDPEFRQEFVKVLMEFMENGEHSIVLATHLTRDLERLSDYVTFLDKGRLVFSLERGQLEERYRMVSGEAYKLRLLPKEQVIYKEKREFCSRALVKHNRLAGYDRELQVEIPSLEDIMYYILKGKKGVR
ncbi:MAG: ABC transporter ATP-binding protein [Acetivibrio ethanolgignens]